MSTFLKLKSIDVKTLSSVFLCWFFIFGPVFVVSGTRVDLRFVFLGLIFFLNFKSCFSLRQLHLILAFLSFALIYLAIGFGKLDFFYSFTFIKVAIFYIVAVYLSKRFSFFSEDDFLRLLLYFTLVNSVFIVMMGEIEFIRVFIQKYQYQSLLIKSSGNLRMQSFNGMEGATLSFFTFLGLLATFFLKKVKFLDVVALCVCLYSFIYSGRTGLFLLVFFVTLRSLYAKDWLSRALVILFFLMFTLVLLFEYEFSSKVMNVIRFATTAYNSDSGMPFTISVILKQLDDIPNYTTSQIFIGAYSIKELSFVNADSDIGYLKQLATIGLLGVFVALVFFFIIFIKTFSYKSMVSNYLRWIIAFTLVFNCKANVFVMSLVYFYIVLVFEYVVCRFEINKKVSDETNSAKHVRRNI